MDGGVIAIIFFALVIGIILVIVLVSIKKRKQYKELLPAAIEWVDEAKGKGYDQRGNPWLLHRQQENA